MKKRTPRQMSDAVQEAMIELNGGEKKRRTISKQQGKLIKQVCDKYNLCPAFIINLGRWAWKNDACQYPRQKNDFKKIVGGL